MEPKIIEEGVTFDDVLLLPDFSRVTPDMADTTTRLTRNIQLHIPLLSAPMDTVTESAVAIALAQEGGIGIIHRSLDITEQSREVAKVKRSENGVITDPVCLTPDRSISDAIALMDEQNVSGVPITLDGTSRGAIAGILTRRDLKFHTGSGELRVGEVMTSSDLITGAPSTTLETAHTILNEARVEKLLLVDSDNCLAGLITMRDIDNLRKHANACRDGRGRLRVGAAVGVDQHDRVESLIQAEADVIVIDTAHGHSANVIRTVEMIRKRCDLEIIAGNIATSQAASDLISAGVDGLKVGIGPGSICTTRIVTGVGVPQLTAIMNVVRVAEDQGVPVIADGGVRQSGDIAKALAAGANSVMLGSLLAGLDESPGDLILHRGRRFKSYRGMGSMGAMGSGSADRYAQSSNSGKFVPEGIEGRVPYRGSLSDVIYQMVGGVRAAMGYCGCATIDEFRTHARFVRVSSASLIESHPHDIQITQESPNYSPPTTEH